MHLWTSQIVECLGASSWHQTPHLSGLGQKKGIQMYFSIMATKADLQMVHCTVIIFMDHF